MSVGTGDKFSIEFVASGRGKAQCPPNPDYPTGICIDVSLGARVSERCEVDLPYPAPECGVFIVECRSCHYRLAITAAGRPDDPKKVLIPCQWDKATIRT